LLALKHLSKGYVFQGQGHFAYCAERAARRRLDSSITEETPT
jgi:hypothetical protein